MSKMDNTVILDAEVNIDYFLLSKDPAWAEQEIRTTLARQIANKIVEEDLYTITSSCPSPLDPVQCFRMRVKIVQE